MSKHTPGPWKLDGGEGPKGEFYVWTDRQEAGKGYIGTHEVPIATVNANVRYNEGQNCTKEEIVECDARLIAAAPEMLAACRAVLRHENLHDMPQFTGKAAAAWRDVRDLIEAAIARTES